MQGWKEEFPDIMQREKVYDLKIDPLIDEFEKFLESKWNGLPYRRQYDMTLDELYQMVTGLDYAEHNA